MYIENKNIMYKCSIYVIDIFFVKKYDNIIINVEYLNDGNYLGVLD